MKQVLLIKNKILLCLMLSASFLLGGCGITKGMDRLDVVVSGGMLPGEVFRVGSKSAGWQELVVYMGDLSNHYENIYGEKIWQVEIDGVSLEDNIRDMALAYLSQIKGMVLLAEEKGVVLTEEEESMVRAAADKYISSLSGKEAELLQPVEQNIISMYEEYALAVKVHDEIIGTVVPEISDDEARTITVAHILIKDYRDVDGEIRPYDENESANARKRAEEALAKVRQPGADFEAIASEYTEDDKIVFSFGKGEMNSTFEEEAFNLGKDEISDCFKSDYGYHIIKCLNTFNRENTEENKSRIVKIRQQEIFDRDYGDFIENIPRDISRANLEKAAERLHDMTLGSFFDLYDGSIG